MKIVFGKTVGKKEAQASRTEAPRDTSCVVQYPHSASSLLSGPETYK
jgi:hypothetical protein